MSRQPQAPKAPRYVIRFANGTWIIFDRVNYVACEAFSIRKEAERALNA